MLGICYGFQLMVTALGGTVSHTGSGEYGATRLILAPTSAEETRKVVDAETAQPGGLLPDEPWTAEPLPHEHLLGGALLDGLPETQQVWMSHGDTATAAATRVHRHRGHRGQPGRGHGGHQPAGCTGCSSTRR